MDYMREFLSLYQQSYPPDKAPPIPERVANVFAELPRHQFLPSRSEEMAQRDHVCPMFMFDVAGEEQYVNQSEPTFVLYMLANLGLDQPVGSVLEIGIGTGWVSAILSHLADRVYGTDVFPELAQSACDNLAAFGNANAEVKRVPFGTVGWRGKGPFDRIIVSCGMRDQDITKLIKQLAPGGIAVVPVRVETMRLCDLKKVGDIRIVGNGYHDDGFCLLCRITKSSSGEVKAKFITTCSFIPFF